MLLAHAVMHWVLGAGWLWQAVFRTKAWLLNTLRLEPWGLIRHTQHTILDRLIFGVYAFAIHIEHRQRLTDIDSRQCAISFLECHRE